MKIAINICFGGYSLSKAAYDEMGLTWDNSGYREIERNDPRLIACIEKLGSEAASGRLAELKIVEIPDDSYWEIQEYDGAEQIIYSASPIMLA